MSSRSAEPDGWKAIFTSRYKGFISWLRASMSNDLETAKQAANRDVPETTVSDVCQGGEVKEEEPRTVKELMNEKKKDSST